MASDTADPIDMSHPPPSYAVPPERSCIVKIGAASTGDRPCNFSTRGNHLAYAATYGLEWGCEYSLHLYCIPTAATLYSIPTVATLYSIPTAATLYSIPTVATLYSIPTVATLYSIPTVATLYSIPTAATLYCIPLAATL